jgi:PTS system ascorbate-specific IIB component
MLLKIMVERVINNNNLPIKLDADVLAAAKAYEGDFVVAMQDLIPHIEQTGHKAVGIKNMVDRDEILTKLQDMISQLEGK